MSNFKGEEYLKGKLARKSTRVKTRYKYYDMKNVVRDMGISTPPDLRGWKNVLGWCAAAVDKLADRLVFRGFDYDPFDLNGIFNMNNPDVLFDSAIVGALISSCDFIYISPGTDGFPRLQVIDGGQATGIIDPITGMLHEGYAVLEKDDRGNPTIEAYFTPEFTKYKYKDSRADFLYINKTGYTLLVPIIHRPTSDRPFGHSRISRACMSIVQSAARTAKRSEVAAEFYSFPQKYVVGTDPDAEEKLEKWKATMSSMLEFSKDDDGDHPILGQFAQASMEPHLAQLRMFASMFAGETGLTLDDLGFPTENPASAEAIKAAHENLRLAARKAQRTFGSGFLNAGFVAACMRDKFPYVRSQMRVERPAWEPIFEPDAAMLSSIGDGAIKINQAVPGYINENNLRDLTGIEPR